MNNNRVTGNKLHGGKQWVTKVKLRDDEEEAAAAPTLLEFLFHCSCAVVKFYGGSETEKSMTGCRVWVAMEDKIFIAKKFKIINEVIRKILRNFVVFPSSSSIMYVHALTQKPHQDIFVSMQTSLRHGRTSNYKVHIKVSVAKTSSSYSSPPGL